jgi:hypothetical protein
LKWFKPGYKRADWARGNYAAAGDQFLHGRGPSTAKSIRSSLRSRELTYLASPYDSIAIVLVQMRTGHILNNHNIDGKRLPAHGFWNRIRLADASEESDRKPLLTVETTPELGEEIWRLEVSTTEHPRLLLNSRVPSIEDRLLSDPVIGGAMPFVWYSSV